MAVKLARRLVEGLIFGAPTARRFTQDSPILPDVWIGYAERPGERLDLLITPRWGVNAGELAEQLRGRVGRAPAGIAHLQGNVVARLDFEQLVRVVVPLTGWWYDHAKDGALLTGPLAAFPADTPEQRRAIVQGLEDLAAGKASPGLLKAQELLQIVRLVGTLAWALRQRARARPLEELAAGTLPAVVDAGLALLATIATPAARGDCKVYSVNLNRPARISVRLSTMAVKADAAKRLFDISCKHLTWAILDTGIDARHPAFVNRDKRWPGEPGHRVTATYDFSRIRQLLDPATTEKALDTAAVPAERRNELRDQLRRLRRDLAGGREIDWGLVGPLLKLDEPPAPSHDHGTHVAGILAADWRTGDPVEPPDDPGRSIVGMCPDIRLYDLRVLGADGAGDEFGVIGALQFVRYLNSQRDYIAIHGVNLSLSIRHDVANYACGRTPVCEECERLVASGTVVVAAAGNQGYLRFPVEDGTIHEGYNSISITDPGNAAGVITVGSTHRQEPHTYGVSYFSSRGPTGDGRRKPDLVAPGEKILAPVPHGDCRPKDGTSMAAPHVSGAAAMLMARHVELVADPARIKAILCRTATDLGREPYFQGHGVVDVLRALQSV
jgi:hypothetical protein